MMKLLIALSAFQTILLVALGLRVLEIDARTDEIATAAQDFSAERSIAQIAQSRKNPPASAATETIFLGGPGADEIRNIIREEVAYAMSPAPGQTYRPAPSKPLDPDARVKADILKKSLRQELDYLIGQGKINDVEMVSIQQKIARLPASERAEFLTKLTKAMSSGEIKAQL